MPADEFSFDITPQDAINYLSKRQKTELSWHWSDVQKQEHMRAFTVYSKIGAKEIKALCAIPNKIEKEVSDWGLEKLIGKDGAENIFDREKARLYIERLSQYGTCSFYTI